MTMDEVYYHNGILVRRAEPGDGPALLANMRKKDIEECLAFGMSPGRGMRKSVRESIYARTALVDGVVVAMWGIGGALMSDDGCAWMVTGNGVEKVKFAFIRISMWEIDKMHEYKSVLSNYVHADYTEAVRFFKIIGFSISEAAPIGKHGKMFHQITSVRA
jgi:hypothetical protein